MKLYATEIPADRPDILSSKYIYGVWYGAIVGLTFSLFTWGVDAIRLNQMNGLYPWLKFLVGLLPCMIVGGLAGWLSARVGKPLLSLVFWVIAASVFAWFSVSLPLQLTPQMITRLDPGLQPLLHYTYFEQFSFRFVIAYIWMALFAALAGLLQIPMSDSAVFSASAFGKVSPLLVATVLMAIAGSTMDNLNNELLRGPVDALNSTVQYYLEHQNQHIDPADIRRMHLSSLRTVENLVTANRKFIISGYDEFLGDVQVLAKFEHGWVECEVLYNQPLSCKQVGNSP